MAANRKHSDSIRQTARGDSGSIDKSRSRTTPSKLLEAIINSSPTVAFVWDMTEGWPVAFVSDGIRQFGYTPEEFYSRSIVFADLIYLEDLERVRREVADYMATGTDAFQQQYRLVCRSGEVRWVSDWTQVLRDTSGETRQNQGIILDITAQVEAEQRARHYLKIGGVAFVALNHNGRVIAVNDTAMQLTGETEENLIGCDWIKEFVPEEQAVELRQRFEELVATVNPGEVLEHENDIVSRSGKRRSIHWHYAIDHDVTGHVQGIIKFGMDISQRQVAERRAEEMARFPKEDPNPVFRIDRQGDFLVANPATEVLINRLAESPQNAKGSWRDLIEKARHIENRQTFELTVDGQIFLFNAVPVMDREYVNIYGIDISEEREKEHRLTDIASTLPGALFQYVRRPDGSEVITYMSPRYAEIWDIGKLDIPYDPEPIWEAIHPEDRPIVDQTISESARDLSVWNCEFRITTGAGELKWLRGVGTPRRKTNGDVVWNSMLFDVTEFKYSQDALRQSEKLQAVGQMAGGIAHDLNNILGIVLGNVQLAHRHHDLSEETLKHLDTIGKSALRAADLTRNLLGVARKDSERSIETVDINEVIRSVKTLVSRSLTPGINIELRLSQTPCTSILDRGDLEDAILNLALNARDAMPDGGTLTITTTNETRDTEFCDEIPGAVAGEFIRLSIGDTGRGISPDIQKHIFEPFFTSKLKGKGTGLGLTMVSRFVKQSDGHIAFHSEPGTGTTFDLYLPRSTALMSETTETPEPGQTTLQRGHETILVVDDESDLRDLVVEMLESMGYRVLAATNGAEALQRLDEDRSVALMISDVIMPGGMNGFELSKRALKMRPDLKILLASGFADQSSSNDDSGSTRPSLLMKPFSDIELSNRIRELLDQNLGRTRQP